MQLSPSLTSQRFISCSTHPGYPSTALEPQSLCSIPAIPLLPSALPSTVIHCSPVPNPHRALSPLQENKALLCLWKSVTQKHSHSKWSQNTSSSHHNSYLNEFIFNPTENSMKLSKISVDQKWNSLSEKIRDTK